MVFETKHTHFDIRFSKPPSDRDNAQNREATVLRRYKGKGLRQCQRRAMVPSMHLSILFLFFLRITSGLDVSIPTAPPIPRAPKISPSFVSFSIEQDRWTDWVGLTSRNQFFINTLENLQDLTGVPPQIRIGANSEDHTNFNPSAQTPQLIFPAPSTTVPYPEATNITVGNSFYASARFLPNNTHVIWGVNLGQDNITAAFLEAKAIIRAFHAPAIKSAGIVLDAIEIGNEADLYMNNGARPKTYTSAQYVKEWISFAANISAANAPGPLYWGAAFAGSSHSTSGFSPQAIFNEGILSSTPGQSISMISQHHYSGTFCFGNGAVLQDLMTKAYIRSNLTSFSPDIAATRAQGLPYVLGETNSFSCHGTPGVSNTAGAALWTLDYLLFASQLGVSRIFFHQGIGFKYNLIQPVTLTRSTLDGSILPSPQPPHVQPQYYAAIIAAEAIGDGGNTVVIELNVNDTRVSGYAFYEGTTLARAVFINSQAFLRTNSGNRASKHIDLDWASEAQETMRLKRLIIGHADDVSGLSWGGQSYETPDGTVNGTVEVEVLDVSSGFDIQETEVVMITFI